MLSPEEIEGRDFLVSLRGFDRAEVRSFLAEVAAQVGELQGRLEDAEAAYRAQRDVEPPTADIPDEPPKETGTFAGIGRETERILEAAKEAAEGIIRQGRVDADREVQAARREAVRIIAEGEQRREAVEAVVAGLEAARAELSEHLREVGRTLDRVLAELAEPVAATVREALTAELRAAVPESTDSGAGGADEAREGPAEPPPGALADPVDIDEGPTVDAPGSADARATGDGAAAGHEAPVTPVEARGEAGGAGEPRDAARPVETSSAPEAAAEDVSEPPVDELADVIPLDEAADDPSDPHGLRGSALTPLRPTMLRAIKRALQEVQNVTLDRLRRAGGEAEPTMLLPGDDELSTIAAAAADPLAGAYRAGTDVASLIADRELPDPSADRDLVADFRSDAAERVRSPLAATLRMGRSTNEPPPALFDRVAAVFAELRSSVAEELATTHLMRAYELGLIDAWAAGGITHRRWVLGREPRCPEARCRHNDQAGVVAMGATYPSGHEVPPVHVGCSCTTVPVSESSP
ncbi:MAG TPA: DivIVA domain-containing protein [Egibacteraceae bacterium]|nr:DivIVA domain-containing protein [Egibacteraceae bacterium]